MRSADRIITVAVTAILAAAATVTGVVVMQNTRTPPSLAASPQVRWAPVTMQQFADPQQVEVTVASAPDNSARVARDGLVTALDCHPGTAWSSGTTHIAVDGIPLLAFHTSAPLWRDLQPGMRGQDVDAVKAELKRLGQSVSAGTALHRADVKAMQNIARVVGADQTDAVISPSDLIWIANTEVMPKACDVGVGQRVATDTAVMSSAAPASVTVAGVEGMLPGSRVLKVDGSGIPLTDQLTLVDPSSAVPLLQSSNYRAATQAEPAPGVPVTFTAVLELSEPSSVGVLPPGSVRAESQSAGCVRGDRGVVSVKIVSSALGRTLVVFDDTEGKHPRRVSAVPPKQCN